MKLNLEYGRDGLPIELPFQNITVLAPKFLPGLPDEAAAFRQAVRSPIGSRPLKELISSNDRVAVVIPDITRPLPSERLLPWLFEELAHVPAENFTIINGTGSHRVNTPAELSAMVGPEIACKYRIVNHNAHDPSTLIEVARLRPRHPFGADLSVQASSRGAGADLSVQASSRGADADLSVQDAHVGPRTHETGAEKQAPVTSVPPLLLNRDYVQADKRIVLGFIEPHFMAGFSGGYKAVFPGVADIASIMRYHDAQTIGDPRSNWGVLEGNPTQAKIRASGSALPIDFCINLTLNRERQITRFFCGDVLAAHAEGCAFSKSTVMVECPRTFPIVLTTNSGYPLDQNLYQSVKGMHAAAQIVEPGGLIVTAARCNDGFPEHGNFKKLLFESNSPRELLDRILAPGFSMYDQWEAQLLALICLKARVALYSEMPATDVSRAHLEPITDIARCIGEELSRIGSDTPIAVLPEGPMTIPYLSSEPRP